jgi:hypothetical protein
MLTSPIEGYPQVLHEYQWQINSNEHADFSHAVADDYASGAWLDVYNHNTRETSETKYTLLLEDGKWNLRFSGNHYIITEMLYTESTDRGGELIKGQMTLRDVSTGSILVYIGTYLDLPNQIGNLNT